MGAIEEAAKTGNRRDLLVAIRDNIARTLDSTTSGRDTAALTKRLIEVADEIAELDALSAAKDTPLKRAQAKAKAERAAKAAKSA